MLSECHDDSSHPIVQKQLSPPASGNQPLPRVGSINAQLPRFQAATATSGQIPLLAPPPAKSRGPTLARLSGTPGDAVSEHVTRVAVARPIAIHFWLVFNACLVLKLPACMTPPLTNHNFHT